MVPKIAISDKISKYKKPNGKYTYVIKVVNKTLYDISLDAELFITKRENVANGSIYKRRRIALTADKIFVLKKNSRQTNSSGMYDFSFRFTPKKNLEDIWKKDNARTLRFCIYAKHSLSGLGKHFVQEYFLSEDLFIEGQFEVGDTLKIVKNNVN
ncbi:MAG: hypothetical protein AAFQ80_04925 [Cyanobacteria bacterium J06621_8]